MLTEIKAFFAYATGFMLCEKCNTIVTKKIYFALCGKCTRCAIKEYKAWIEKRREKHGIR